MTYRYFNITTLSIHIIRMNTDRHYIASGVMPYIISCPVLRPRAGLSAWPPQYWKEGGGRPCSPPSMVLQQSRTTEHKFSKGLIFIAVSSIHCKHILIHLKKILRNTKKSALQNHVSKADCKIYHA